MSSTTIVLTLAILAIVLVIVPLLSMTGMMTCCGAGMMRMGGGMFGMSALGIIWLLGAAAVVIALVVMRVVHNDRPRSSPLISSSWRCKLAPFPCAAQRRPCRCSPAR